MKAKFHLKIDFVTFHHSSRSLNAHGYRASFNRLPINQLTSENELFRTFLHFEFEILRKPKFALKIEDLQMVKTDLGRE